MTALPNILPIKTLVVMACLAAASLASAECRTGPGGRTICSNGEKAVVVPPPASGANAAAGYNAKTGTAWKSTENANGVPDSCVQR